MADAWKQARPPLPPQTPTPASPDAVGEEPESEVWDCPKGQRPPTPREECSKEHSPLGVPPSSPQGEVPEDPQQPANALRGCWDLRTPARPQGGLHRTAEP
eukprot:868128-Prorocentrum_lima.AAC.1